MTCSLRDTILELDRAVPRYTSYPTAPNFKQAEDKDIYTNWLQSLSGESTLSLYLHVPFCSKMCWYCGCHTKVTKRYDPIEAYVNLMLKEIELLGKTLKVKHKTSHIHFGGGTPGILQPYDFERIMKRLNMCFDIDDKTEIAIEIDPRSLDRNKAESYARCGVTRVSLGVQDVNHKVLESVNRPQPLQLSFDAVRLFKRNGIKNISIDLLYGLPHQSVSTMEETIEKAMLLEPNRVSLFGYAHVPWMKKHMSMIDETALPDKSLRYDLFEMGHSKLIENGYVPIGIDHFAKPNDSLSIAAKSGQLRRNFQGYTTDTADALIGIGSSSIGKFPEGYTQNAVDMPIYQESILSGELPIRKFCAINKEDNLRASVIERLMCDFKADIPAICKNHGFEENHLDHIFDKLESFKHKNLLSITDNKTIIIESHAKLIARLICAEFDAYYSAVMKKPMHAKAV